MSESKNESVVDTLFDVGEAWASYGLKVAELALQTSARTLTNVSKVLGTLSDELKTERERDTRDVIDAPQT
jgi:hypothetical protein